VEVVFWNPVLELVEAKIVDVGVGSEAYLS
jgi:hypothetical protein